MQAHQHPRLLSDFRWHGSFSYRAKLDRDCTVDLRKGLRGCHEFYDEFDFRFAILEDDRLTMMRGLTSDLCSPATYAFGFWIGTPSGNKEALAAYVHDTTRQILAAGCVNGLTRKMTDDLFYDFLTEARSKWNRLFHHAVAGPVGTAYMMIKPKPIVYCSCHNKTQK
jgi:hypothetical protein